MTAYLNTNAGDASGAVWAVWTSNTSAAASTSSSGIWAQWTSGSTATTTATNGGAVCQVQPQARPYSAYQAPTETPEQQAERIEALQRQVAEANHKRVEAEAAKEAAEQKAKTLLLELLSDKQRAEFEKDRAFHVLARDGTRYRVTFGWAGNIEELTADGKIAARLCIHPREDVPVHDNLVTQKLLIENDIDHFRKTANRTPVRRAA